jgi:hypothetical protein
MVAAADYDQALQCIARLVGSAGSATPDEIVAMMKKIVPEFKSLNSMFETLDAP